MQNLYQAIPQELRRLPNWVCWQAVQDERSHSGVSKRPIDPKTGNFAKSNDPSTWADFDTAVQAAQKWSGIGFMFSGSGYFGVDLDDIAEELQSYRELFGAGAFAPFGLERTAGACDQSERKAKVGRGAKVPRGGMGVNPHSDDGGIVAEFISALQSYAEVSQSGTGIHIICKGSLPEGGRRRGKVEMYDSGRFFVMTGQPISEYAEVTECSERIRPLHEKYIGGGKEPTANIRQTAALPQTADEILRAAANSKNGAKFKALYSGDISGYSSQSEADMALCNMLAFWTGCDAQKMDAMFRASGLMREKWDRKQSGSTYGVLTVQKAIAGCTEVYRGKTEYRANIGGSDSPVSAGEPVRAEKQRLYSFDDTGNAQRFCDLFGGKVRYSYTDKRWLYYDGRKWCTDMTGTIGRLADKSVEAMAAEAQAYAEIDAAEGGDMSKAFQKHVKASRSNKSKKAMLSEAMHYVPIMPSQLDRHKGHINTPAGAIELKTGRIIEHSPEHYFSKLTNAEYDPYAECPLWHRFLEDIFAGDKELIRYVQKAVGYSLSGSTAEQCMFFLLGSGRNGKSTFIEVIRDIFGDYASNIQPESIMVKRSGGSAINSDIARLKGARLVTCSEPNEGARLNEGLIKQLTGGDPVTARKLYGEEFEFQPEFKLWVSTNHKPIIRGTDIGVWRRIHLIPFNVQIPESKVDRQLKYKLEGELTGIFRWAVDGCLLYRKEGLRMPKIMQDSVKEYHREMDVLSAFIEDCCTEGKGLSVQSSQLYAAYLKWAEQGNEYTMSATKFSMEIAKRYEKVKTMKCNYYSGIGLI